MKFQLVESFDKIKYTYKGPIYSNNGLIAQEVTKSTYARSISEAARNIKYQLFKDLGIKVDIDVSKLYSQANHIENKIDDKVNKAPEQLSFF